MVKIDLSDALFHYEHSCALKTFHTLCKVYIHNTVQLAYHCSKQLETLPNLTFAIRHRSDSKAITVTTTKRINHNLLRKETSFVCYTSSVLIQVDSISNIIDSSLLNQIDSTVYVSHYKCKIYL